MGVGGRVVGDLKLCLNDRKNLDTIGGKTLVKRNKVLKESQTATKSKAHYHVEAIKCCCFCCFCNCNCNSRLTFMATLASNIHFPWPASDTFVDSLNN